MPKSNKPASKKPASKKPSNANASKPKPESKPARAANPRGRKLGDRVESVRERLTLGQIEEQRKIVCELWRTKDDLDSKKKAMAADFKSRISDIDQKIKAALAAAQSGYRDVEITVEEWLTPQNQVQRYRQDTGELIGDRSALAADLQESLPFVEKDEAEGDEDEAEEGIDEKTAAEIAEIVKDSKEAEDSDFGG